MKYNEEQHEWKIRIITAQTLRENIGKRWNRLRCTEETGPIIEFWLCKYCKRTRVSCRAKNTLHMSETLECFTEASDAHYELVKKNVLKMQ